jgi:hypothetical protein
MTPPARTRHTTLGHDADRGQSGAPESGADPSLTSAPCSPDRRRCHATPRPAVLAISVSFEPSRVAAACLAAAYEHVVPRRHRAAGARAAVPAAPALPRRVHSGEGRP